ncbi:MAG: hypothetical protein EXQ94_00860 [Alphaproteobacteria bacterium]|nr:hypothetical protein [Alphaproteobacteria bacterium]
MAKDVIRYDQLMQDAMRGVVVQVLKTAVAEGLPGKHHFLISFRTHYPGVDVSEDLRGRYPQDMTIVLQYQYWDLNADDHKFWVTLSFNKVPRRLVIPFAAITGFADPEAKFDLHFAPREVVEPPARPVGRVAMPATAIASAAPSSVPPSGDGNVVPLDTFRRK